MKRIWLALIVLVALPADAHIPAYDRAEYPHWEMVTSCRNLRHDILAELSLVPVTWREAEQCHVIAGEWRDPYSGKVYTSPRVLHIDHIVAIGWTHPRGGWSWPPEQKREFANDRRNLVPTYGPLNVAKGRLGPDAWIPPLEESHCWFGQVWDLTTRRYRLALVADEWDAIAALLETCPPYTRSPRI